MSSIIRGLKSITTKQIHKTGLIDFKWQSRFYLPTGQAGDHIIRNEKSLNNIRHYIRNNPLIWESDMDNPENSNKKIE